MSALCNMLAPEGDLAQPMQFFWAALPSFVPLTKVCL